MIIEPVDCKTLVEMVTEWMEGALEPASQAELELHIAACAGCIAYVEQLRATLMALAGLEDPPLAEDVRLRLLTTFREKRPAAGG
jgi:anti-sigma factor RsiW